MKNISILGVTGSIGTQTLDVLRFHKEKYNLVAISAHKNVELALKVIKEFNIELVCITDKESFDKLSSIIECENINTRIVYGMDGLVEVATHNEVDIVVTSVVGMIGLRPTIEAINAGKDIALANKETLVVAGELVMGLAKKKGVKILPVDSEHSAIFQSLQGNEHNKLYKILLTASGGPFRGYTKEMLKEVTVEKALKHPKWNMGQKISIDSSTLMNKGLEVIEAHFLFDCPYEDIEVVVHPESIIHSMVEYKDGAVIAQLGVPDMKLPIQYALNYPKREDNIGGRLDFKTISSLNFEVPNIEVFSCLKYAFKAGKVGGLMPAILNGANEAAVDLFLNKKIEYLDIERIIRECMEKFNYKEDITLENVIAKDKEVREYIYKKYSK
ncbi:1-deoxy-D-xylulose-5-phosphate reductoisomerase [uncultured Clostridium sp.]|jgi:1-deoxy-D-xylulose-5-phosphate reductoisomerase|uniref:1-deoxy-D-xylulose-5-phosphate reductoisomerase n=1 Tax=uncultured Clostridium sp. TaxID=59620 RepID=UPI002627AADA|nr:1-deoxy-D-xylulose-5-phosphate reductoisomerase [uncultured Clostridium sp.]